MADLEQVHEEDLCGGRLFTFRWEGDRMVRAWMPHGHDPGKEALPCLWMQDGQNVFRDEVAFGGVSWGAAGTVAHLADTGCIPRMAVIAVDHAGMRRSFDYLPVPPGDWGGMRQDMASALGGNLQAYCARVLSELVPWAERRFGLSPKPQQRALAGSSFGGVATLYMAMLHPDAFRAVLIESPSFWACDGLLMQDVKGQAGKSWPERIYLAMGGCEYTATRPGSGEAGSRCDKFLTDACMECAAVLQAQGVDSTRLDWHVDPGAAHNERDWRRRFPRALRWLLAGDAVAAPSPPVAFWTRPAPVVPGRAFEIYADPVQLQLPQGVGQKQVHLGFNSWACDVQTNTLQPAGLPKELAGGVDWLAALCGAPTGAVDLSFAVTDGTSWDNNGGSNYALPVALG